jgi:hypothetical protein
MKIGGKWINYLIDQATKHVTHHVSKPRGVFFPKICESELVKIKVYIFKGVFERTLIHTKYLLSIHIGFSGHPTKIFVHFWYHFCDKISLWSFFRRSFFYKIFVEHMDLFLQLSLESVSW